jgi:hypothetical protein
MCKGSKYKVAPGSQKRHYACDHVVIFVFTLSTELLLICLFVIYLMRLSVTQTLQRRMFGCSKK